MFNEQYQAKNVNNIAKFKSLRLTLIKVVLKFIALGINYAKVTNAPLD